MALIVEDGTGLANADSFASLATALAYHAAVGNAGWTAAGVDDAKREIALRKGTAYIRDVHAGAFQGDPIVDTQALPFPRYGAYDLDGLLVASDSVPLRVVEATCELALRALTETILPDVAAGDGALASKSVTVGPISTSKSFVGGGASPIKRYTIVEKKLAPYFATRAGRVYRG